MKIKDLRSTVRELVLGVKGRKKEDVIQVFLQGFTVVCIENGNQESNARHHLHG